MPDSCVGTSATGTNDGVTVRVDGCCPCCSSDERIGA
uniref:Uncharacterized protein n=1 Tax=Anopheles arabiensis TaxID=7173 RepID=A0A182IH33_ANOAR